MKDQSEQPFKADPFVIVSYLMMWIVAIYPLIASVVSDYSTTAAIVLLVALPLVMAAILVPIYRRVEQKAA